MPISLTQKLRSLRKVVRVAMGQRDDDRHWMVWWHCGIIKNRVPNSQPSALVAFRELLDARTLADKVVYRRVPLTALGQVRIGTVWLNGCCEAEAVFETVKLAIDFRESGWRLTSFGQAAKDGSRRPFPLETHPLEYPRDKNWLLAFALPAGGELIVPCVEFFTRCYGRSAELRRVLTTYSWEECKSKRLYAPLDEPEDPTKWSVKLRKRLVNGDVILLAHAKYDTYAEYAVKSIYAQIEANYDPASNKPAFIRVAPWFRDRAMLKVRGVSFDDGRSFLALQMDGCSQPGGVSILRDRENSNKAELPDDSGDPGSAWSGARERKLIKFPEIVDLTDDVEPDPDAISAEIGDPDFEELGEPRVVIDRRKERAQSASGQKVAGVDVSTFSSGEPHGRGQGVGYASIHARPMMESTGALRDVWNAMLFLQKKWPSMIESVEWFSFDGGYRQQGEPRLIGLQPFEETDKVTGTIRKWPYIDTATLQEIRGILVARVIVEGKSVHILEIQRRPQRKKGKDGKTEEGEESFKGLAFVLDNQQDIGPWLQKLLSEIRHVKGVVQKLVGKCPGKAAVFKHSPACSDEVPYEAAVLNALYKMGVNLPT